MSYGNCKSEPVKIGGLEILCFGCVLSGFGGVLSSFGALLVGFGQFWEI